MSLTIFITRGFEQMSEVAADQVTQRIQRVQSEKEEVVLGLATGSSPTGLYNHLIERANGGDVDSGRWRTFNLDEYIGLPGLNAQQRTLHAESYSYFMIENLFSRLERKPKETFVPWGNLFEREQLAQDLESYSGDWRLMGTVSGKAIDIRANPQSSYLAYVRTHLLDPYAELISRAGGIDLQILGVGGRGHVAFHEAGIPFDLQGLILVELDEITRQHAVADGHFADIDECPRYAVTMSLDLVFQARASILLANGERKSEAIRRSLLEDPDVEVPLSYAQLYVERGGEMVFVLDEVAAKDLLANPERLESKGYRIEDLR